MALNVACPPLALISIYGEVTGFHQFHDLQKPAKAEDTQLSVPVKDGSDPLNVACPPLIPIQSCFGSVNPNEKIQLILQLKKPSNQWGREPNANAKASVCRSIRKMIMPTTALYGSDVSLLHDDHNDVSLL